MKQTEKEQKFDCSGEDCRSSNCDIRRDLVDLEINQRVIMRDLSVKAVQLDGLIEVFGVANTTLKLLFQAQMGKNC